jgi:hypothetical protein
MTCSTASYHEADLPAAYCRQLPAPVAANARAGLEAFLNLALDIDGGRQPGVAAFLERLQDLRTRDPDAAPPLARPLQSPDAVRLITVHSAKGLEWPLVWLADAAPKARGRTARGRWSAGSRVRSARPGRLPLVRQRAVRPGEVARMAGGARGSGRARIAQPALRRRHPQPPHAGCQRLGRQAAATPVTGMPPWRSS